MVLTQDLQLLKNKKTLVENNIFNKSSMISNEFLVTKDAKKNTQMNSTKFEKKFSIEAKISIVN